MNGAIVFFGGGVVHKQVQIIICFPGGVEWTLSRHTDLLVSPRITIC